MQFTVASSTQTTITVSEALPKDIAENTLAVNGTFSKITTTTSKVVGVANTPTGAGAGSAAGTNASAFAASDVGSTLVVSQTPYTILAVNVAGQVLTLSPPPAITVTDSSYYLVRNNSESTIGRNKVAVLWKPPISLFESEDCCMGSANDYKLDLTPSPTFQAGGVQASAAGATYKLVVTDVKLFIYVKKMSIPNQISTYKLNEVNVQSKPRVSSPHFSSRYRKTPTGSPCGYNQTRLARTLPSLRVGLLSPAEGRGCWRPYNCPTEALLKLRRPGYRRGATVRIC